MGPEARLIGPRLISDLEQINLSVPSFSHLRIVEDNSYLTDLLVRI